MVYLNQPQQVASVVVELRSRVYDILHPLSKYVMSYSRFVQATFLFTRRDLRSAVSQFLFVGQK